MVALRPGVAFSPGLFSFLLGAVLARCALYVLGIRARVPWAAHDLLSAIRSQPGKGLAHAAWVLGWKSPEPGQYAGIAQLVEQRSRKPWSKGVWVRVLLPAPPGQRANVRQPQCRKAGQERRDAWFCGESLNRTNTECCPRGKGLDC